MSELGSSNRFILTEQKESSKERFNMKGKSLGICCADRCTEVSPILFPGMWLGLNKATLFFCKHYCLYVHVITSWFALQEYLCSLLTMVSGSISGTLVPFFPLWGCVRQRKCWGHWQQLSPSTADFPGMLHLVKRVWGPRIKPFILES